MNSVRLEEKNKAAPAQLVSASVAAVRSSADACELILDVTHQTGASPPVKAQVVVICAHGDLYNPKRIGALLLRQHGMTDPWLVEMRPRYWVECVRDSLRFADEGAQQ